MKSNTLEACLESLMQEQRVTPDMIPDLDLYMDQLITFFEKHLGTMRRKPDDKLLTKSMINNYAKNKLIMPAKRKKYTQDNILLMLLIYQLKQVTGMADIKTLFDLIEPDDLLSVYQTFIDQEESLRPSLIDEVQTIVDHLDGLSLETPSPLANSSEVISKISLKTDFPQEPSTPPIDKDETALKNPPLMTQTSDSLLSKRANRDIPDVPLILLLFHKSLTYKRLAEDLLDTLTPDTKS